METPVQSPRVVDDLHSRNASDRDYGDSRIFNSDGDMTTREELVKAMDDAMVAYYAADDLLMDAMDAYDAATNALAVYDKENT
jgi:hypothetical protein